MQKKNDFEQQKKDFQLILSKFSHELRNPLTLLYSELQMMASSHPEITSYREWENVLENIDYMQQLLNELSSYQNAGRISPVETDLTAWLNTIIHSFRPALDYLGISLETDIPAMLPRLFLDQTKMRQAFLNLLQNAQESIRHPDGMIRLSVSASADEICISITDNGCGMTTSQLNDIFHPFVTYRPGGTGIGLAVTRQIIQAHQGSLSVKSTPGKGSCFSVRLPLPCPESQNSSHSVSDSSLCLNPG